MSLIDTNLLIQASPIPATFKGTPDDFAVELVRRMKIVSPSGTNFIFIGNVEPTSNVGPWLKDGNKWYVWDDTAKKYIPVDISDSFTPPFFMSNSEPISTTPPVWLQTTKDATDQDPSRGEPIGWLTWDGTAWVPFVGVVLSGPTASRPQSPVAFQQYYDTDISALIWFERGAWRTVDGLPGDVKIVTFPLLADALTHNPGWALLFESDVNARGRTFVQASVDPGATPVASFPTAPGITPHPAFDEFGETIGVQSNPTSGVKYPALMALWHLVKQ
jgi:hypothetical protein